MTNSEQNKVYWSTQQVYTHLQNQQNRKIPFSLPEDVYCTKDFKWNEVLITKDKFFQMPSMEILDNLNELMSVVQRYRTILGKKIRINSSWRTKAKQDDLFKQYKQGLLRNEPSETSLHLEGLAVDISVVDGSDRELQKLVNDTFAGEAEFGGDYTHLALPTFSKGYLQRHGLYRDDIYKKLVLDTTKLPKSQRDSIEKRLNPTNWNIQYPSTFDPVKNAEFFGDKNLKLRQINTTNVSQNVNNEESNNLPKVIPIQIPISTEDEYFDIDNGEYMDEEGMSKYKYVDRGGTWLLTGKAEMNNIRQTVICDKEHIENNSQTVDKRVNSKIQNVDVESTAKTNEENEKELLEQLKSKSAADIVLAEKIRNEGKILEKLINNQVQNDSQSTKPSTQEELEKDELYQRIKKERGQVKVINSNEFSWEQIIKDTLAFPNAMRDFCYPSEKSPFGKSGEIFTNISDIKKNEYYTPPQPKENRKSTHGRYLNPAHEEEIERVVSSIFDSVAREMGY